MLNHMYVIAGIFGLAVGSVLALQAYDNSQTTTSSATFDALATVRMTRTETIGNGKVAHVIVLGIPGGDEIVVSGKDADDMETADVGMVGKNRVHVLYVRVDHYNRRGQLKYYGDYLAQWRWPTQFELAQAQ
jgi:hypothetical protein